MLTDPFGFVDPRNPRALSPPEGFEDVHIPGMSWAISGDRKETTSHISPAQWNQILAQFRALLLITGVDLSDLEDGSPYILREALTRAVARESLKPAGAWALDTDYEAKDIVENDGSTYYAVVDHTSAAGTEPGIGVDWATVWKLLAAKGDQGDPGIQGDPGPQGDPGTGDMDTAVYDTNDDGKVDEADVADAVPWAGVTDKPATLMQSDASQTLTVGFPHSTYANGAKNSGTFTPAIANGHKQSVTLDGAALAFPADICDFQLDITNGASAAAQSFTGVEFDGDLYDNVDGNEFRLYVSVGALFTHVTCKAKSSNT